MKLLFVLTLLAFMTAPLRCRAEDAKASDSAPAPAATAGNQTGGSHLTLIHQEKKRPDLVHFVIYRAGASYPDPSFGLWTPTELRAEYEAIPTETGKFAWIADHLRAQLQNGDMLSGNDLGILHLYGFGVEKDWKKAEEYFVEPVKHGRLVGQRYLAELLVMPPEQPQNARHAGELLIPLLKAGYSPGIWAAEHAEFILSKSRSPEDKDLAKRLVQLMAGMIQSRLKAPPSGEEARTRLFESADRVAWTLLNDPTAPNCQLAESIITAWLAAEPDSARAKIRSLALRVAQKDVQREWTESTALLAVNDLDESPREWAESIRVRSGVKLAKLGKELSWDEFLKYSSKGKYKNLGAQIAGVLKILALGFTLVLLAGLSLWTRFRRKDNVGILLLLLWGPISLIAEAIMLGPTWAVTVYCPIAIFFLTLAAGGPRAWPYFLAPRRNDSSSGQIWLVMAGLCVLLYFAIMTVDISYAALYLRVTGVELGAQAIKPFLKTDLLSRKLAMVLAVGVFIPAMEEIVFRGLLHDWLSRKMPLLAAMILGSVLFGLLHGLDYALPLSFLGMACLWLRLRFKSLIPPMIVHGLNNTVAILLLNVQG
jgi:membrane protease YdiL (CAAX protease family)